MNRNNALFGALLPTLLALAGLPDSAKAVEVYAGSGIGYTNDPNRWMASIVYSKHDKKALIAGLTTTIVTGQDLTPTCNGNANTCPQDQSGIATLTVPRTTSTAWCDPDAKPQSNGNYTVTASFDEPSYADRDTVFNGSFNWDPNSQQLTSFSGKMNQVMVSSQQNLNLQYLKDWAYDSASQTVKATVFKNDTTAIYKGTDAFNNVSDMPLTDGTQNAYFTLIFNSADPTSVSQINVDNMIYGDCVQGSLMGGSMGLCMTGVKRGGTMGGVPLALSISHNAGAATAAAAATDSSTCYGSAIDSKWVVVDLNGLKSAGLNNVWIKVTANRFNDLNDDPDDDLIPALTVFRGRQDVGAHGDWYPNQFQENPFWAWKLSPFHTTERKNDTSGGFKSAYGAGAEKDNTVSVVGNYMLKPGNRNYLSIAVGGDSRDSTAKHPVNFELSVSAYIWNPDTPKPFANSDACGCEIGVKEWHAAMNHCMDVRECEKPQWKNGPPGIRCQTPAECTTNHGRWSCTGAGVQCK